MESFAHKEAIFLLDYRVKKIEKDHDPFLVNDTVGYAAGSDNGVYVNHTGVNRAPE